MVKYKKIIINRYKSTSPTLSLSFKSPYYERFMDMLLNRIYFCEYNSFKCDHTFKETKIVLSCLYFDVDKSIAFLEEHGGCCDCQVMQRVMKEGKGSMRKLKKKEYSFTEATEIVNKRDEEICQNCGDIVLSPRIARLSGAPQDFNPDNFILVCGRCFQKYGKRNSVMFC